MGSEFLAYRTYLRMFREMGDADAEDVNNHSDKHGLSREGVFCGSGQGNYNPIHEKVDGDSVEDAVQDGMIDQKADEPAGQEEDGCCTECNKKMKQQAEKRGSNAPTVGAWAKNSTGDSLQKPERLRSHCTVDNPAPH